MTEKQPNDTYKLLTLTGAKRSFVLSQKFFVCHPKTSNQNQTIVIITYNTQYFQLAKPNHNDHVQATQT